MTKKEKQSKSAKLTDEKLEYAHRFAIERLSNENRTFWTRLSALLLGNSFLIVGFASLYGSNSNDTLLLAIAAAGILIQAMWPLFALLSYSTNQYLVELTKDIEKYRYPDVTDNQSLEKKDIENRVRRIWTNYAEHFWGTLRRIPPIRRTIIEVIKKYLEVFKKSPARSIARLLFFIAFPGTWIRRAIIEALKSEVLKRYPAGLFATILFFIAFLGIWICALIITI